MLSPHYNVQHSPIGAFASFTLGFPGTKGGLGLELGRPANEAVFIGAECRDGSGFEAFPFFETPEDPTRRFDQNAQVEDSPCRIKLFEEGETERELALASDTWRAGDLEFRIYSRCRGVPDPSLGTEEELRDALAPALIAELTMDNREGDRSRQVFFGYQGADPYSSMHQLSEAEWVGVGQGTSTLVASGEPGIKSAQAFTLDRILRPGEEDDPRFGLGGIALLKGSVAAGERRTFHFVICFFRGGPATAGLDSRYFYTRLFQNIQTVATYAWQRRMDWIEEARRADACLATSGLSPERQWMLAQAVHSYYGSTQLLEVDRAPFWVVNEGEYRMMNTFDLTVDQVFFELALNPWTVRNELDWFRKRFSYQDQVRFPGDEKEFPGGISFTHDMGVANVVWRPGYSSYEKHGIHGCFSHMTHEELVNWVLCGLLYAHWGNDPTWVRENLPTFTACLDSMVNRDHPVDELRNGVMGLDSSRCGAGSEITTYDSLDASLGQARNNLYLAVKSWASYVGLRDLLERHGLPREAHLAARQAQRGATTISGAIQPEGYIPAVIGEGVHSRIIPAIEGLVFPHLLGISSALAEDGEYGALLHALRTHLESIMQPGVCLFQDGGFKLSSSSSNSWLSKIYLCQYIMETVMQVPTGHFMQAADSAHAGWLNHPEERYWAWSDQMIEGVARGSKYYPRGVTAILWLLPDMKTGELSLPFTARA